MIQTIYQLLQEFGLETRKKMFSPHPLLQYFNFFSDSLPVLDVSAMKHIAYVFDALIYFLRNATTQSVTDETAPDSRPSSVDESFAPVIKRIISKKNMRCYDSEFTYFFVLIKKYTIVYFLNRSLKTD